MPLVLKSCSFPFQEWCNTITPLSRPIHQTHPPTQQGPGALTRSEQYRKRVKNELSDLKLFTDVSWISRIFVVAEAQKKQKSSGIETKHYEPTRGPSLPLLHPAPCPLPREEGANCCFLDPHLGCPREGTVLVLPFPPTLVEESWEHWCGLHHPQKSLSPSSGKALNCVWEWRRGKCLHWALHFTLQRTASSTILCCSLPASFPDWQQSAHCWTGHKMKT